MYSNLRVTNMHEAKMASFRTEFHHILIQFGKETSCFCYLKLFGKILGYSGDLHGYGAENMNELNQSFGAFLSHIKSNLLMLVMCC